MSSFEASTGKSSVKRVLPLKETESVTLLSLRYSSQKAGQGASHTVVVCPRACQSSSLRCGVKGARSTMSCSSTSFERHFCCASSPTAIMKAATDVLYEKSSISSVTFLMSLCRVLRFSFVGASAEGRKLSCLSQKSPHTFFRKRKQPSMPLLSQGLLCEMGPRNIS